MLNVHSVETVEKVEKSYPSGFSILYTQAKCDVEQHYFNLAMVYHAYKV